MLTINDEKIKINKAELNFKIVNEIKKAELSVETYLGIFEERMDIIHFDIEINRIQETCLMDLERAVFYPYNLNIKKIYTEIWRDKNIKEAKLKITDVQGNVLKIILDITGKNKYHIETLVEATWFIGKANLSAEKNLELIDQHHNIEELNPIPFIEMNNKDKIKFMFEKPKENIIWE